MGHNLLNLKQMFNFKMYFNVNYLQPLFNFQLNTSLFMLILNGLPPKNESLNNFSLIILVFGYLNY
jgi:hypothetical protein